MIERERYRFTADDYDRIAASGRLWLGENAPAGRCGAAAGVSGAGVVDCRATGLARAQSAGLAERPGWRSRCRCLDAP
jgi:hypothetical protein